MIDIFPDQSKKIIESQIDEKLVGTVLGIGENCTNTISQILHSDLKMPSKIFNLLLKVKSMKRASIDRHNSPLSSTIFRVFIIFGGKLVIFIYNLLLNKSF